MKTLPYCCFVICLTSLLFPPLGVAGKGYMGGQGNIVVQEPPPPVITEPVITDPVITEPVVAAPTTSESTDTSGVPDTVTGPLNDKMADSGKLFGDLYKILRHKGVLGEKKLVPAVDSAGKPILTGGVQLFSVVTNPATLDEVIGGEPILTVVDAETYNPANRSDYGWYAVESGIDPVTGAPIYTTAQSPYPAQCVQPVADFKRWGDISSRSGLTKNRLPMVITYDATWGRSECSVGQLDGEVVADPVTGTLTIPINDYFIEPCEGTVTDTCRWIDPNGVEITFPDGVLWTELLGEVHFGRLNIGRSPEAVLQSAFDEAINNLNSPDTVAIGLDATGRLLLTKNVYDEYLFDPMTGLPLWIGTVQKAIDSPLENVALYVKLMQDGHLVTPADERAPIDRSKNGGIPLWKMLELTDGPAAAAIRPTIDIAKMQKWGLDSLVDVTQVQYYTYYQCLDAAGAVTPCLCRNDDPAQPELDSELIACANVASRVLVSTDTCPVSVDPDNEIVCEGPFKGIETDGDYAPDATDLGFTAAFLAAAADKTGDIGVDMVVYLNSILGINKVVGYSSYEDDGTPSPDAIDYSANPQYFNYKLVANYDRAGVMGGRGFAGSVTVLEGDSSGWSEKQVVILTAKMDNASIFDNLDLDNLWFPNGDIAKDNILGFTQQADDNLGVIAFTHTFQIPSLR